MSITIQQEHYSESFTAELLPLLQQNWRESPSYEEGLDVDPLWHHYRALDAAGQILCLTLREEGRLTGYVVFILGQSMRHQTVLCARGEAFFVDEARRGHGLRLLDRAIYELRERRIQRIGWAVDEGSVLYRLLKLRGFEPDEIVMEKTL